MKRHLAITAVSLAIGAVTLPALAQSSAPSTPGIDKRQANQERRIEEGRKSGQLTDKEAARLEKGQERVQKMEDKAGADGKVTAKERERIRERQDAQSDKIREQRRDKQTDKSQPK
jgi:hypothetical protein